VPPLIPTQIPRAAVPAASTEVFTVGASAAPKFHVPPIAVEVDQSAAEPLTYSPPSPAPPLNTVFPTLSGAGSWSVASSPSFPSSGTPTPPGHTARPWGDADFSEGSPLIVSQQSTSSGVLKAKVDPRGGFAAVLSLLLVGACFLPYYMFTPSAVNLPVTNATVLDHAFGPWRIAILVVAVLCVLVGIVNSVLRVGVRGAVGVFFALRVLALAQLALWVVALIDRSWSGVVPLAPGASVSVTWVAYVAVLVAFATLGGSVASLGKH